MTEYASTDAELTAQIALRLRLVDKLVSGVVGDEVYQVKNAELEAETATRRSQIHDAELDDGFALCLWWKTAPTFYSARRWEDTTPVRGRCAMRCCRM